MSEPQVIYVDIIKANPVRAALGRPQLWRWIAKNAGNQKKLAKGTERYTNRAECLAAVVELFADATVYQNLLRQAGFGPTSDRETPNFTPSIVYLREAEQDNKVLRLAA